MALYDDKERYLRKRLEQANFHGSGFAIMTDQDRWLRGRVDSGAFRGNMCMLTVNLRHLFDADLDERRAWARVLQGLVEQRDLLAVLVASALRETLNEHTQPALRLALDHARAEDPLSRMAHDLLVPERHREVVTALATQQPPPLMLALVAFVPVIITFARRRSARLRDLARVLLALDAFGEESVLHLLASESTRQVPYGDGLACGLLVDLLPSGGLRSLLRQVFGAGRELPPVAHGLPLQLALAEALRHCLREDLVSQLTRAMLRLDRRARGVLAEALRGKKARTCRLTLDANHLAPAVELLRSEWVPDCARRELLGAALAASGVGEPVLERLLEAVPHTAQLDRLLLDAVLERLPDQNLPLPRQGDMARLEPVVFAALGRVLSDDLPRRVGQMASVALRHGPWRAPMTHALGPLLDHPHEAVVLAALDACARLGTAGLAGKVRSMALSAGKEVARAAREALVALEGRDALKQQAEALLQDPVGKTEEMGADWLVATVVQLLASLRPLHEQTARQLQARAAVILSHHPNLLAALAEHAGREPEGMLLLEAVALATDSARALTRVLDGLCPLLVHAPLRPVVERALAHLPVVDELVEPSHELQALRGTHLAGATPAGLWSALGRPGAREGFELLRMQEPSRLMDTISDQALQEFGLWLLGRGDADNARALTLLESLDVAGRLTGGGLQPLLVALVRLVDEGGAAGPRALRLARRVRALVGQPAGEQSPYRGGGDLEALDHKLKRAADHRQERSSRRMAAELVRTLEDAVEGGPAAVDQVLGPLVDRNADRAIIPIVVLLETSPGGKVQRRLERALAALAEVQADGRLICLDCVAPFEKRTRKTGLLSRVSYQACGRCRQSGHYAAHVARVVLEVSNVPREHWYRRVDGDQLRVDWRQCVLRDQRVCRVDEVALHTTDRHTVEWFRAWYTQTAGAMDQAERGPLLRVFGGQLAPDLRDRLLPLFNVV